MGSEKREWRRKRVPSFRRVDSFIYARLVSKLFEVITKCELFGVKRKSQLD